MQKLALILVLIPLIILVINPLIFALITLQLGGKGQEQIYIDIVPFYWTDIASIVLSLAYGLYPLFWNIIGLNKRFAIEKAYEYQLLKTIISIEMVLLIVFTFIFYMDRFGHIEPFHDLTNDVENYSYSVRWLWNYMANLSFFMTYAVIGGLVWIVSNLVNKDYYYYIAKGNSEQILENNWIGKARRTLKYYNKYLSRVLESRIRDTNGVISKLLFSPGVDRHAAMKLLYESFQSDDKLNPLTSIEKGLDIKDVNDFLKSESLADRLKAWGTYVIATIIPIVISVIQLIWKT